MDTRNIVLYVLFFVFLSDTKTLIQKYIVLCMMLCCKSINKQKVFVFPDIRITSEYDREKIQNKHNM